MSRIHYQPPSLTQSFIYGIILSATIPYPSFIYWILLIHFYPHSFIYRMLLIHYLSPHSSTGCCSSSIIPPHSFTEFYSSTMTPPLLYGILHIQFHILLIHNHPIALIHPPDSAHPVPYPFIHLWDHNPPQPPHSPHSFRGCSLSTTIPLHSSKGFCTSTTTPPHLYK